MNIVQHIEECGFKDGFDTCVTVHTSNFDYPFSFIEFETDEVLGILATDENGCEKLKILNKKFVEAVEILYADDLNLEGKEKEKDRMFS